MYVWEKSNADSEKYLLMILHFTYSLCSTYDLNKQTARIDAFIPICGVRLFQAEKADGFVNLPDFTVEKASECKKKQ